MIQKQGVWVITPRIGLGYVPFQPVMISGRRKVEQSLVQYIMAEEADNEGGNQAIFHSRASISNRLQPFMSQRCPSVFNRIGEEKAPKLFVF